MMKSVAFLSLSLAALVGCGGGETKKPIVVVDAPGAQVDAPTSTTCTMAATNGAPTFMDMEFTADYDPNTSGQQSSWFTFAPLNADAAADFLVVELYQNFGTDFSTASPQTPLTVELTGVQADYATCAACIRGLSDLGEMNYADDYMPKSGTLTLTAASDTKLTGSISNLVLTHVTIEEGTFETTVVGDCDSSVGNITFDLAPAMAKSSGVVRIPVRVQKLQK